MLKSFKKASWKHQNKGYSIPLIFFVVALILVITVSVVYKKEIYSFLDRMYLIPREEAFTELYFDDHPTLSPEQIVVKNPIPFTFTIHNREGKDTEYEYQTYFKFENGSTSLIDFGNPIIKAGESKTFKETYYVENTGQRGKIVVYIIPLDQEIFFHVPNKNLVENI